jgi:hypothetical protein
MGQESQGNTLRRGQHNRLRTIVLNSFCDNDSIVEISNGKVGTHIHEPMDEERRFSFTGFSFSTSRGPTHKKNRHEGEPCRSFHKTPGPIKTERGIQDTERKRDRISGRAIPRPFHRKMTTK